MSADSGISAELLGTVIAVQANYYHVRLDQPHVMDEADRPRCGPKAGDAFEPIEMLLCLRRSRLKKIGVQVMVGDRVRVEEPDWVDQRAAICEVLERDSLLDRPRWPMPIGFCWSLPSKNRPSTPISSADF
jgi:ribosome biogenesis GTPase / thiamine phosphate phosphatase